MSLLGLGRSSQAEAAAGLEALARQVEAEMVPKSSGWVKYSVNEDRELDYIECPL